MNKQVNLKCADCNREYKRYYELRKHVKLRHPDKIDIIAPLPTKNLRFKCSHCKNQFSRETHLKGHMKRAHSSMYIPNKQNQGPGHKCTICDYSADIKQECIKHYERVHDIRIEYETIDFESIDDFVLWKDAMEKETVSKFIKKRGTKSKITDYVCHRSGFYSSKSKGKRHLKTQGSNKINGYCPAMIKQITDDNGKCKVHFTKTHVGHRNELSHLSLTTSEHHAIAAKLAARVPFDVILDEVRDGISTSGLERLCLLTRKDLFNIKASFNLHSTTVRDQNDAIDAWVNDVREKCILFYKPQDVVVEEYPQLKSEDFVLMIMNADQRQILKKFANDCVCLDRTHGTNSYQFELHTLLVLDDLRQGFPCAFCISNRSDEAIIMLFFNAIKKKTGAIKAKVFMSDMADVYYDSWSKVMSETQFRLFCTWHVDNAWRKNLSLISSKEKQESTYKSLRILLQETDITAFEPMLQNFLTCMLDDSDTFNFGIYFRDNYERKVISWAHCHRLHAGLDTNSNMHMGRMHQTIKYIYLHGKIGKRLDKTINALMRFIRDKLYDRIIVLHKRKICSKIQELRKTHKTSIDLDASLIVKSQNNWQIPSSSKTFELYNIYENDISCDCRIVCTDCEACIHKYSCSCSDCALAWSMCEHIHLLCRYLRNGKITQHRNLQNEECEIKTANNDKTAEAEIIFDELINPLPTKTNKPLVKRIEERLQKITTFAYSITTEEEFAAFEKLLLPLESTIEAVRHRSAASGSFEAETAPTSVSNNVLK